MKALYPVVLGYWLPSFALAQRSGLDLPWPHVGWLNLDKHLLVVVGWLLIVSFARAEPVWERAWASELFSCFEHGCNFARHIPQPKLSLRLLDDDTSWHFSSPWQERSTGHLSEAM